MPQPSQMSSLPLTPSLTQPTESFPSQSQHHTTTCIISPTKDYQNPSHFPATMFKIIQLCQYTPSQHTTVYLFHNETMTILGIDITSCLSHWTVWLHPKSSRHVIKFCTLLKYIDHTPRLVSKIILISSVRSHNSGSKINLCASICYLICNSSSALSPAWKKFVRISLILNITRGDYKSGL
jgi:hypothetical protein